MEGKGCRCVQPTLADCPEILHAPTSWNPRDLYRSLMGKLYLYSNLLKYSNL